MKSSKTTVDWLRFRTQVQPMEALEALRPLFGGLGPFLALEPLQRGILGFQQGAAITVKSREGGRAETGLSIGRMDYGGDAQRGWVRCDIPGSGCEWVRDWDAVDELEGIGAELRRVDLALTTWRGEVDHARVVDAHARDRFCCGGRPPALQQITSTDPRAGRSCNIGQREKADKFFRGYEKGFELVAKAGLANVEAIDGFPLADIYRCEVEFKAENRPIPLDVIPQRDSYAAGAYPFMADLLPGVEADILMRRPERAPQLELKAALGNLRRQFGNTLFTAAHAYHGDIGAVWAEIVGRDHNEDLLRAGVLMVDH